MEYKFLSDGRKVAVVGKINSAEYIVQEIFITPGGDEIPSGEKFTTKSLHDAPVKSWLDKSKEGKEAAIKKLEEKIAQLDRLIIDKNNAIKIKSDLLANSPELKEIAGEHTETLARFMAGTIEYVVTEAYQITEPKKLLDNIVQWDNYYNTATYDGLRLLCVLGKSKGNLSYNINRYGDGSGYWEEVYPCATYEEALQKTKEIAIKRINKGSFSEKEGNICKKLGITFDAETTKKMVEILSKSIRNNIAHYQEKIAEYTKSRDEAREKLEEVAL